MKYNYMATLNENDSDSNREEVSFYNPVSIGDVIEVKGINYKVFIVMHRAEYSQLSCDKL